MTTDNMRETGLRPGIQDFENLVTHLTDTVRLGFPMDRPADDFDIEEAVRVVLAETDLAASPATQSAPSGVRADDDPQAERTDEEEEELLTWMSRGRKRDQAAFQAAADECMASGSGEATGGEGALCRCPKPTPRENNGRCAACYNEVETQPQPARSEERLPVPGLEIFARDTADAERDHRGCLTVATNTARHILAALAKPAELRPDLIEATAKRKGEGERRVYIDRTEGRVYEIIPPASGAVPEDVAEEFRAAAKAKADARAANQPGPAPVDMSQMLVGGASGAVGQPVAWIWEEFAQHHESWLARLTVERPLDGPRVRSVHPLYAHPQPAADAGQDLTRSDQHVRKSAENEQVERMREALEGLCQIIRAAGVRQLSRGVELGPVSWAVKMDHALDRADRALASLSPSTEEKES